MKETRKTRRLREIIGTLMLKMYLGEGEYLELKREAFGLTSKLPPCDVRRAAYDIIDDVTSTVDRRQCHKEGVWVTKDWDHIPVSEMEDSHLTNVARMLFRKAESKAARISAWYTGCPEPHGEMAQVALEQEQMYWLDYGDPVADILKHQPIWKFIEAEIEKRGLAPILAPVGGYR